MVNLILTILFSSILFIVLKSFPKFKIDTFQAIVFNYIIAFAVGLLNSEESLSVSKTIQKPWIWSCFFLGFLFIGVFFVIGKTAQKNGVSVASVASKMSLVIPILFGIFYFKETFDNLKIIGICIALVAVFFTTKKETIGIKSSNFIFPILVFLGSGIIDTSMNFIQQKWVNTVDIALFSSLIFFMAFSIGLLLLIYLLVQNQIKFQFKSIIGGVILGIPNYYSLYFLIHSLQDSQLQSATIFTIINISVILLTTLFGLFLFKEKLRKHNYIGIILAIFALYLVTY